MIEVAIVRPGPIQGGAVHPYLRRRQGFEPVTYPSDALKAALGRTLGVPIFQEQVMQVAILAAGFTPGEADQLRRAMAAWKRKGGLEKYYDRIVNGMRERGYKQDFAEAIFEQIKGFGEYGFPESHAASFALLVYASSWLKCHEPAAFLAAMLNSQPMGFYSPSQLVQDAKRHGVQVLPVDVTDQRLGFAFSNVSRRTPKAGRAARVVAAATECVTARPSASRPRARSGHSRASVTWRGARNSTGMICRCWPSANALASLAGNRREALWQSVAAVPDKDMLADARRRGRNARCSAPRLRQKISSATTSRRA